jgi:hypothetical protein
MRGTGWNFVIETDPLFMYVTHRDICMLEAAAFCHRYRMLQHLCEVSCVAGYGRMLEYVCIVLITDYKVKIKVTPTTGPKGPRGFRVG